ncbi:MAG TPA: GDP-L-fucose synthase [Thermoanaerobaculia bacterium]|nr:GDP-L-fucose synthase [Thermoanaerobaculia bacterium]
MSSFWHARRVLLTGSGGFLGRTLKKQLEVRRAGTLLAPRSAELDLLCVDHVRAYLTSHEPHLIIHAAGLVGGIGANRERPGRFFYENAAMGMHLIEESRKAGVERFVCIGSVCGYPKTTPVPFREADMWDGYPEETNAPYGLAKKMLLVQLQAYRQEYGFDGIFVVPTNIYGPGDNFDPATSHAIPAMIRKFTEAAASDTAEVVLWGDGSATRDFLYVDDAAEGILQAAEQYDSSEPVNLGSGNEVSIREVAGLIARLTGFGGTVRWDAKLPNGQPRRSLDSSRAREAFGFAPRVDFVEGLRRTIAWFEANRAASGPDTRGV